MSTKGNRSSNRTKNGTIDCTSTAYCVLQTKDGGRIMTTDAANEFLENARYDARSELPVHYVGTAAKQKASLSTFQHFRMEHRSFVIAVVEIGLEYASPLILQELISPFMKEKYPSINELARIKSRLQHYRKNPGHAIEEFGNVYDSALTVLFHALRGQLCNKDKEEGRKLNKSITANLGEWSLIDQDELINQLGRRPKQSSW